ncbi:MAG TPA: hypothetical protein VKT32_16065 [Chthonomonadaceae bacterium]|nr:hypothetical protein [Chthonomonadaceae bacterium]
MILGALGCTSIVLLGIVGLILAGVRFFREARENQRYFASMDIPDSAHEERRAEIVERVTEKFANRLHNISDSFLQRTPEEYPTQALVYVYTHRPPQSPLAIPHISGYKTLWGEASWYPILFEDGRDQVYKYRLRIARQTGTPTWPAQLKIDLTENSASQAIMARLYPAGINAPFKGTVYYSNNWEVHGPHVQLEGNHIGTFPSARGWTWLGLREIQQDQRQIEGFVFQPPPVIERWDLSEDTGKLASVAAAWLPDRTSKSAVRCTIFYEDGSRRAFNVAAGATGNGLAASWGLPTDLAKQLPPTSF